MGRVRTTAFSLIKVNLALPARCIGIKGACLQAADGVVGKISKEAVPSPCWLKDG